MQLFTRFLLARLVSGEAELYMEMRNFAFRKSLGIIWGMFHEKNFTPQQYVEKPLNIMTWSTKQTLQLLNALEAQELVGPSLKVLRGDWRFYCKDFCLKLFFFLRDVSLFKLIMKTFQKLNNLWRSISNCYMDRKRYEK